MRAAPKHSQQESETEGKGFSNEGFYQLLGYEWRVLRFNSVTRQSVAKVKALATIAGEVVLQQQPNCIAFECMSYCLIVPLRDNVYLQTLSNYILLLRMRLLD